MSGQYTEVEYLSTGDVVTAKIWNEQFVDNWQWLRGLRVGDRALGEVSAITSPQNGIGSLDIWVGGAKRVSDFQTLSVSFPLPNYVSHIRVMGYGFRSDYAAVVDQGMIQWGGDNDTGSYNQLVNTATSTGGGTPAEFLSGEAGARLVCAGGNAGAQDAGIFEIEFNNPQFATGGAGYIPFMAISGVASATATTMRLRHTMGRWDAPHPPPDVANILIVPRDGTTFTVGGANDPVECGVDVWASVFAGIGGF